MSTIKNILFMGASTAIRLGCGMLAFIIMARQLGSESYGVVMLWFSISSLICLVPNFGLAPYILREIAKKPELDRHIMGEVLTAKLLLSIIVLSAAIISLPAIQREQRIIFILILSALLFDMVSEYLNVGFRATNRFRTETKVTSVIAFMQFMIIYAALKIESSIISTCIAFFLSRAISLTVLIWVQRGYFGGLQLSSIKDALRLLKETLSFALDFGFQNLFGQIDSIVISNFIGQSSVGIYQAGMRFFMGGAQCAGVLSNVLIGDVSKLVSERGSQYNKKANQMLLAFSMIGIAGWIAFFQLKFFVVTIFGQSFAALSESMSLFGALFFVRFCAAGFGLNLTINGFQQKRMVCTIIHWIIVFGLLLFVNSHHINDWLYSLLLGNLFLVLAYMSISICEKIIKISLMNRCVLMMAFITPLVFRL